MNDFKLIYAIDRGYMIPYTADGRKLYKVGVVFSMGKRNVADYEVRNCGP